MSRIIVLGYSEAAMLLRQPEGRNIAAVLSICGQREFAVEAPHVSHHLTLEFDDTEALPVADLLEASRLRLRQREAATIGLRWIPPTREHAEKIIEFAEAVRDTRGAVLCHCFAGISRSPAAAILCVAVWLGPGHERECVAQVMAMRPSALPHRDLISFGDELLRRDGNLIRALE